MSSDTKGHTAGHNASIQLFHKSIGEELRSLQGRVRCLVKHRPTDGAFKEELLRIALKRHLPETLTVGRGFIVKPEQESTEIDVLIVDKSAPTLFKAEDLLIVTPDAVRAIVEVKSSLQGPAAINDALKKLAENKAMMADCATPDPWTGLFVFDADKPQHTHVLRGLHEAWKERQIFLDCVAYGPDQLTHVSDGRLPNDEAPGNRHWRSADTPEHAASNFIALLLVGLQALRPHEQDLRMWWPEIDGYRYREYVVPYFSHGVRQFRTRDEA